MSDCSRLNHFKRGLENEYPMCCIMWFIFEKSSIWKQIPEYTAYFRYGFLPCPLHVLDELYILNLGGRSLEHEIYID